MSSTAPPATSGTQARQVNPAPLQYTLMASPVGELLIIGDEHTLHGVSMQDQRWAPKVDPGWLAAEAPFERAVRQLQEYFAGERVSFDLPLRVTGTPFRLSVWWALCEIPFGETRSYGQIAASIGKPHASRAVGLANGRNPFAIVVPCHRVIGKAGQLVGYGGGLDRKRWLLRHETDVAHRAPGGGRAGEEGASR